MLSATIPSKKSLSTSVISGFFGSSSSSSLLPLECCSLSPVSAFSPSLWSSVSPFPSTFPRSSLPPSPPGLEAASSRFVCPSASESGWIFSLGSRFFSSCDLGLDWSSAESPFPPSPSAFESEEELASFRFLLASCWLFFFSSSLRCCSAFPGQFCSLIAVGQKVPCDHYTRFISFESKTSSPLSVTGKTKRAWP